MKTFWHIARILLGLVFIFSGFVKGVDPWGMAYKFTDYFNVWGMDSLTSFALPLGILLSATEFAIGIALVFNTFISFTSILAVLMMSFFTVLTFILALTNPVTDCGCFGDALILTNWETFFKNIVFFAFAIVVFAYRKRHHSGEFKPIASMMVISTILVFAYLIDYSYNHLPIIDFRPYKIGVNIPEGMTVPDDAPKDVYENTLYYKNKNTGEIKEFTEENSPWQDSINWEYESIDTKLVQEGYKAPIHNFFIETAEGEDIKDFFLYDENFTFFFISKNLDDADTSNIEQLRELAQYANDHEINFIGLTSSLPENVDAYIAEHDLPFEMFNADEITLKTMIRSNPGLMLIKNGTILDKWHYNDFPTIEEFEKQLKYFEVLGK
ncbi:BT_3928 family protein [uncultured Sunxiuqinia sp.]|uniref:BT_3928 family protein n=1 Tax=uncultured Sunxiuqinia sp. TaxID=1573825 RepID=UPI002AA7BFBA|nr:BT_3928 family protein [uncultured Sunxiuqinia sp.]